MRSPRVLSLPYDRWRVFAPLPFSRRGCLSCFVSPLCLLAFLLCSPLGRLVFSSCFFWGVLALLLCALARLVFLLRFFLFLLVRSPAIVGVSVVEKMLLRPLPRVRALCARVSRVSKNCLHLFTQYTQLLDIECLAVKANCRVFRFTLLPDRCKALLFSKIR